MARRLKNLAVKKVDFVDQGANPDAHIRLFKRRDGAGEGKGAPAYYGLCEGWAGRVEQYKNKCRSKEYAADKGSHMHIEGAEKEIIRNGHCPIRFP